MGIDCYGQTSNSYAVGSTSKHWFATIGTSAKSPRVRSEVVCCKFSPDGQVQETMSAKATSEQLNTFNYLRGAFADVLLSLLLLSSHDLHVTFERR